MIHGIGSQFGKAHKIPEVVPKAIPKSTANIESIDDLLTRTKSLLKAEQSKIITKRDNYVIVRLKVIKIEIKQLKDYIESLSPDSG